MLLHRIKNTTRILGNSAYILSDLHISYHVMWQYFRPWGMLRADESDTHASKVLVSRNECGVALYGARECENKHYQTNYLDGSRFMDDITKETMRLIRITSLSLTHLPHTHASILLHRRFADLLQLESSVGECAAARRCMLMRLTVCGCGSFVLWCAQVTYMCNTCVGVMQIARVRVYK